MTKVLLFTSRSEDEAIRFPLRRTVPLDSRATAWRSHDFRVRLVSELAYGCEWPVNTVEKAILAAMHRYLVETVKLTNVVEVTCYNEDYSYDSGGCDTCGGSSNYAVDIFYVDTQGSNNYHSYEGQLSALIKDLTR